VRIEDMPEARVGHPAAFLVLLFPFGAGSGFIVVTLAYLLTHHGVSVAGIADLTAISLVPQTWKFLWAPVIDTTLTRKAWYVIGAAFTGATIAGTGVVPIGAQSLTTITILVLGSSVASTILGMATDSLAAIASREEQKGRVAGWLQAGNLGGQGIGGGAALWIAQHSGSDSLALIALGALCVACSLGLFLVGEPKRDRAPTNYFVTLRDLVADVWSVAISRKGFLAILILFIPIGTGAAQNLWAAVAGDWRATADTVALVNGALGGVVATIACLLGGYLCDVMDRKSAYALFGVLGAVCAIAMGLAPRTQPMFIVFTLAYGFLVGVSYAAFSAVTLEAIGRGAAATKYNLLASLSNIPIAYMTVIDGWAQTHYGSGGMLYAEAAIGITAVALFGVVAFVINRLATSVPAPA
jgi:MFS family permease